jgi:hypothetical protein
MGESGIGATDLLDGAMPHSRGSRALTNTKRQALEDELRRVKAWCVAALPGLPINSDEYKAVSALLDGVHATEERLELREPHVRSVRAPSDQPWRGESAIGRSSAECRLPRCMVRSSC